MFNKLFFNFSDYKLEKFQLENLATSQVPFNFYSLDPLPDGIASQFSPFNYLQVVDDPFADMEKKSILKESPLVFICATEKKSQKAVKRAIKEGFQNVYFVEGGLSSLNS